MDVVMEKEIETLEYSPYLDRIRQLSCLIKKLRITIQINKRRFSDAYMCK